MERSDRGMTMCLPASASPAVNCKRGDVRKARLKKFQCNTKNKWQAFNNAQKVSKWEGVGGGVEREKEEGWKRGRETCMVFIHFFVFSSCSCNQVEKDCPTPTSAPPWITHEPLTLHRNDGDGVVLVLNEARLKPHALLHAPLACSPSSLQHRGIHIPAEAADDIMSRPNREGRCP
eukprot:751485-Hanusia_phi.AAC.1